MTNVDPDLGSRSRPERRVARFSRRELAIAAIALLAALGMARAGHYWWTAGRFLESTDDAYIGGNVTVIAPKVAGFIAEIAVADNRFVHAGELLVKLDDRDYVAALARADAFVAAQQATLDNLDAYRRRQMDVIKGEQASVAAANAELARARDDQSRFRALSAEAAASLQAFQRADADYKVAIAANDRSRAALSAARRQLDVIATQRRQAEAALAEARAERQTAALTLSYTELRAPIDGYVGNRSAQTGAFAAVGAQLLSLVPAQGLWVDANFKENQLAQIRPGQAVSIEADALSGKTFQGVVDSMAPATGAEFSILPPENATGNFTKIVQRVPVRVRLIGDLAILGRLRPGLSVIADVNTKPDQRRAP